LDLVSNLKSQKVLLLEQFIKDQHLMLPIFEDKHFESARLESARLESARLESARLESERLESERLESERRPQNPSELVNPESTQSESQL